MAEFEKWMEEALAEARQCGVDVPVGAVVVDGKGQIVGRGRNRRETDGDPVGHAEIYAIKEAADKIGAWRLEGCTLVVTLEPCPMCAEALLQARVSTLVYGAADLINGAAGSAFNLLNDKRSLPPPTIHAGIKQEEGSALLKEFFQRRRAEKNVRA